MSASKQQQAGAVICLESVVQLLKDEGERNAGMKDGLLAYAALTRIKGNAEAWGVPLDEIGLADYDLDTLLNALERPFDPAASHSDRPPMGGFFISNHRSPRIESCVYWRGKGARVNHSGQTSSSIGSVTVMTRASSGRPMRQ